MIQAKTELKPANWQTTATTIHCNLVDELVTIMVNRDWTTKCVWYRRYKQKAMENKKQKFSKEIKARLEKCSGPDCSLAIEYRDKLIREELADK